MVEKPSFNPEESAQRESLNSEVLEAEMQEKHAELVTLQARVKGLRDEWEVVSKLGNEVASEAAFRDWRAERERYAMLVEEMAVYEQERGKSLLLPDGLYSVEVNFVHRKSNVPVTKTERIFGEKRDANLGDALPEIWAAISMLGPHNFGFSPEPERQADCRYTLRGPGDFAYRSSVLVDAGGHTVRRAVDVR